MGGITPALPLQNWHRPMRMSARSRDFVIRPRQHGGELMS